MPMCSSRVLFGLESSARARSRDRILRADVFELSPVGGCNYERYVRYISIDEQLNRNKSAINSITKMIQLYKSLDEYQYYPSCIYQVNKSPPPLHIESINTKTLNILKNEYICKLNVDIAGHVCVVGIFHHINFERDCVGIGLDLFFRGYY